MSLYDKGQPYEIKVSAGDTSYICQCGKTNKPPYCDGSHKDTDITPLEHNATSDETLYVCGCGKSGNKPFCDGSHK